MEEGRKKAERRAAAFGLDGKWARMKAPLDEPEKHALAQEIAGWLFVDSDRQESGAQAQSSARSRMGGAPW